MVKDIGNRGNSRKKVPVQAGFRGTKTRIYRQEIY